MGRGAPRHRTAKGTGCSVRIAAEALAIGDIVRMRVHGNSMTPRIPNGSRVTLDPDVEPKVGDAVLAKVRGRYYVHLVSAKRGNEFQISNIRGHVNGWTRQVFGVVTKVEP